MGGSSGPFVRGMLEASCRVVRVPRCVRALTGVWSVWGANLISERSGCAIIMLPRAARPRAPVRDPDRARHVQAV